MRRNVKREIRNSLAGFNTSKRANRETVESFIESYLTAFPERSTDLDQVYPEIEDWLVGMLSKPQTPKIQKKSIRPANLSYFDKGYQLTPEQVLYWVKTHLHERDTMTQINKLTYRSMIYKRDY